jgi:sugar lactone lactonase YvrE
MKRIFLLLGLTTCLLLPGVLCSQTFSNGQAADLVIGQPDFVSNAIANLPNRLQSPRGIAIDEANGKIYLVDSAHHRILRFPVAVLSQSGVMPECVFGQANFTNSLANQGLGAPTARTLNFPMAAFVDGNGRLWVADGNNNRVLRFDNAAFLGNEAPASVVLGQAGFTTATAGTTATTMNGPHGLVLGPDDALWVADRFNNRVLRFNAVSAKANGGAADIAIGQANLASGLANRGASVGADTLSGPVGLFLDRFDQLWIADGNNNRVIRHAAASGIVSSGADADLVIGQIDFGLNAANPGGITAGTVNIPLSVLVDRRDHLWVADGRNRRILQYGKVTALTNGSQARVVLGQPNFFSSTSAASATGADSPTHLAETSDGRLFVTDFVFHRVLRYTPVNGAPTIQLTGPKRLTTSKSSVTLRGTAADADGSVASVKATVNNKPATATGTTSWSLRSRLKSGRNQIKLRSVDDLGLSSAIVTVTVTRR